MSWFLIVAIAFQSQAARVTNNNMFPQSRDAKGKGVLLVSLNGEGQVALIDPTTQRG